MARTFATKYNWEQIKSNFLKSNYHNLSVYLAEKEGMSKTVIDSGQTRRKLGKFTELEKLKNSRKIGSKIKSILKSPGVYTDKLEQITKKGFLAASSIATVKMYKSFFNLIDEFDQGIKSGEIGALEGLKAVPSLQLVLNTIQMAESKILESMDQPDIIGDIATKELEIEGALIEGLRAQENRKAGVAGGGGEGNVYQPQILLKTLAVEADKTNKDTQKPV